MCKWLAVGEGGAGRRSENRSGPVPAVDQGAWPLRTEGGQKPAVLSLSPSLTHLGEAPGAFAMPSPQDVLLDGDVRKRSNDGSWKEIYLALTSEV